MMCNLVVDGNVSWRIDEKIGLRREKKIKRLFEGYMADHGVKKMS